MPRLPHHRLGPGFPERGREHFRALDVEDHRRPLAEAAHGVAAQDHQELVAPDDLAGLVHGADPVGVAVEGDAELRAGAAHGLLEILQVLGHGRVGMVIGKGPVRFTEQRRDLRAERLQGGHRDDAADAVAAVGDDLHPPLQLVAAHDALAIALEHRAVGRLRSLPAPKPLGRDDLPEAEDVVTVKGLAGQHHLETVELGRVVRAGHLHAAVGLERGHREVQRRGRQRADIDRGAAGVGDAEPHALRE